MTTTGKIVGVNGNMITVAFDGAVAQNEVGYAVCGSKRLMAEIVRVRGTRCDMQVFDATTDLMVDDTVEFSGELLAAELGPGMLAQVYDGLQNPLAELAKEAGKISKEAEFFLQRGMYLPGLPRDRKWDFHPLAKVGDRVRFVRIDGCRVRKAQRQQRGGAKGMWFHCPVKRPPTSYGSRLFQRGRYARAATGVTPFLRMTFPYLRVSPVRTIA